MNLQIGVLRLAELQQKSGLSNEGMGREIGISEKTWRRWKKAGSVPQAAVPAVANALRVDLTQLGVEPTPLELRLGALEDWAVETTRALEAIAARLDQLLDARRERSRDHARN